MHLDDACRAVGAWAAPAGRRLALMQPDLCACPQCRRCRRWAWSLRTPAATEVAVALTSRRADAGIAARAALGRHVENHVARVRCAVTEQLLLGFADRAVAEVADRWHPLVGAAPTTLLDRILAWRLVDAARGAAPRRHAERAWFAAQPEPPDPAVRVEGEVDVAAIASAVRRTLGIDRARLVWLFATGAHDAAAARVLGTDRATIGRWRRRLRDLDALSSLA